MQVLFFSKTKLGFKLPTFTFTFMIENWVCDINEVTRMFEKNSFVKKLLGVNNNNKISNY